MSLLPTVKKKICCQTLSIQTISSIIILTTQSSLVDKDSNLTMETELSDTPKPSSPKASPANDQSHHNETEVPINECATDAGSFVTRYPSTLNPFAPEYVTLATPKRAQFTSTPYAQCKESTPNSMGITHNQGQGSPSQANGDILQRLADLTTQRHAQESLPLPEPETFRGDLLHYPTWKKSFDTIIERRADSSTQRLYYLGKYTSGEAKESIRSLLSLDSADAFNEARKILSERYGNPFLAADVFRKKLTEWPKVPPNDGVNLRKFSDFLLHCQTAIKEIKYLKALKDPEENQKMVRKLPRNIGDRRSRELDRWLNTTEDRQGSVSRPRSHNEPVYPPFSAFCDFLKREATIACNPITSSRSKDEDKKEEQQTGEQGSVATTRTSQSARETLPVDPVN